MKKTRLVIGMAVVMLALSGTVSAQSPDKDAGFYTEVGLAQAYYKEPGFSFNNAMGVFKGGYNFNKYIATEVMAAGNLNTARGYIGAAYVTAKVSSAYGGYAKFSLPVDDQFSLFVRGGFTNATANLTATNGVQFVSVWASGTDLSYGAGAQYNYSKNTYYQFDYMSYYNKNNASVVAPSISVGYKF